MYARIDNSHVPGRIRRVRSNRIPGVWHWGVEGWLLDESGEPTVWHAQKNDILRCTSNIEFSCGQPGEFVWTPRDYEQSAWVIQRLESKEGLRWNLATANCEQIVRWAVEGRAHSDQLAGGILLAFCAGAIAYFASN